MPTKAGPGFLRWRSWGVGEHRALLLHGSTSSSATWWRIGPALADAGWRVKAPDLPAHGASPRVDRPLTPAVAAEFVLAELSQQPFGLVVGHSFGALVAVALQQHRPVAELLVLDEPPGPNSVSWAAEAAAVLSDAQLARRNPESAFTQLRQAQPGWTEDECRQIIRDRASGHPPDIAAGLRCGADWAGIDPDALTCPTVLIAAPDAPGVNHLEDATALRGDDRRAAIGLVESFVEVKGGHTLHRDLPETWLSVVLRLAY